LTSQLYFPDDVSDEVLARLPYAERPGRDTTNDADEIFPTGGDPAVVDISPVNDGYRAAICLVCPGSRPDIVSGPGASTNSAATSNPLPCGHRSVT
jgi:hypothetical protein